MNNVFLVIRSKFKLYANKYIPPKRKQHPAFFDKMPHFSDLF